MAPSLIFSILFILSITGADYRAHGQGNESPIPLSPEMYEIFRPKTEPNNLCDSIDCSSLPLAANVQPNMAHEGISRGVRGLAASGIAGIPVGLIFGCLIIVGVYYVMMQRHNNSLRAKLQLQGEM